MLNFTTNSIIFLSVCYLVVGFAIGLVDRWQRTLQPAAAAEVPTPATSPNISCEVAPIAARPQIEVVEAEPVEPASETQPKSITHAVVLFRRNWSRQTTNQLRAACKERDIRWRNAGADGKHLRKQQMIDALERRNLHKLFTCAS